MTRRESLPWCALRRLYLVEAPATRPASTPRQAPRFLVALRTRGSFASVKRLIHVALLALLPACASTPASPAPATPEHEHHHELHLPPVGPDVRVALDDNEVGVALASVPHDGSSASLAAVWKLAFPAEDPTALHFDLVGSDGFHPASRPACARPLTGAEVAAARIDVVTHDVSYDDTLHLPGCYRVKAVVRVVGTR